MINRFLFLASLFLASCLINLPAVGSDIVATKETTNHQHKHAAYSGQISALRVSCLVSKGKNRKSFAAVLKIETAPDKKQKFDVAITTGHGLVDKRGNLLNNCSVSYPGSEKYPIKLTKLANNFKPGSPTDWAVIVFTKIKTDNLTRYYFGTDVSRRTIDAFAESKLPVVFATARGIPVNGQTCKIEPRRFAGLAKKRYIGLLSHNCRAIAGQSGSPISVFQQNTPILIGIHLGNSMIYGYPTMNTPLHYKGYFRSIDEEFMASFSNYLAEIDKQILTQKRP